jgi:lipopolysaccharide transport system ATP-binding protein
MIQSLCKRVLLLKNGELIKDGSVEEVIPHYQNIVLKKNEDEFKNKVNNMTTKVKVNTKSLVDINKVSFLDSNGTAKEKFLMKDSIKIIMNYEAHQPIDSPIFTLDIVRSDGVLCCSSRTDDLNIKLGNINGKGSITIDLGKNILSAGIYMAKLSIWDKEMIHPYVIRNKDMLRIETSGSIRQTNAVFVPEVTWKI